MREQNSSQLRQGYFQNKFYMNTANIISKMLKAIVLLNFCESFLCDSHSKDIPHETKAKRTVRSEQFWCEWS